MFKTNMKRLVNISIRGGVSLHRQVTKGECLTDFGVLDSPNHKAVIAYG